ncbi:MAG: patatin-like phospholipase family protein [Chloroflexota bacterium]
MFPREKLQRLSAAAVFGAADPAVLETFLPGVDWCMLPGGATLFRAGDVADAMYVVLSGRLRIFTSRSDGTLQAIREIGRGESVGELALLTGKPRSASAQAIRDTELARFSRAAFENALKQHPQLAGQLLVQVAERQSQGVDGSLSKRNIRTLAVLPIDAQAATSSFVARLADTLNKAGNTLHLSKRSQLSAAALGAARSDADSTLTAELSALEDTHRYVVYEAEVELSWWTEQCLRQADLILLVGTAGAALDPSRRVALSDYFSRHQAGAALELALLHNGDFAPSAGTDRWPALPSLDVHYHIVPTVQADMDKLVRLLTGSAVGLVLSGGGARGFAHIGVLRALDESGVPIDYIGGTSMGAVIAAQHASGWDWRKMKRVNREQWPRCEPQRNFTLPLVALNSGKRMDRMLEKMFGAAEIQDLREKFFCVSTNLTRADQTIHRSGPLWKAVRASISIPGIGPPAIEQGEILVDGGLINNLPVDVMKKLCQGAVIAVDVSEQMEFKSQLEESYSVSGWKLLWRRLNPLAVKPDLPNIFNILYRATTVGSLRTIETVKVEADLYLNPPVSQFGIFDWRRVDEIIDVGYRYALTHLEKRGGLLCRCVTLPRP